MKRQEVFIRAMPQVRTTGRLSGWLYRIATNLARDTLRHRKRVVWSSLDAGEGRLEASEGYDPQTRYGGKAEQVPLALRAMPAPYCQALLLHTEGYRLAAIAQGSTPHAMKSLLTRARASFRQHSRALERGEEVSA